MGRFPRLSEDTPVGNAPVFDSTLEQLEVKLLRPTRPRMLCSFATLAKFNFLDIAVVDKNLGIILLTTDHYKNLLMGVVCGSV